MGSSADRVMPSGTVSFLFTDVEGSTRLWEERPDAMNAALARHDQLLRTAIDTRGGIVFATGGDGVAAAFARSADAVAAAIAAQRALGAEASTGELTLRVRMGVHTGEAEERDGDYFGPPVNRAARLMSAAHGGQVVVSAATASVMGAIDGVKLIDLGSHRLKGVADEMQVFGVDADGLGWLDRRLVTEQTVPGNLPRPATEYVGRVDVLQQRAVELRGRRVVTLTGPGGVGKTRSAIEAGWLMVDAFRDGVWLVELAPIVDDAMVVTGVGSTLGVTLQPGATMAASIVESLRGRRALLILDNCEHVLAPVAELVSMITTACEHVTVLATSREPLGVAGERVVPVPSLDPDDAVELFLERAGEADGSIDLTADREVIGEICARLDGIPLAIELAAARVRSMSATQIRDRLDQRFRLLTGTRRSIERHQTLRHAVQWSYDLLDPVEQRTLQRISVFVGGFTLAAATAVCAADDLDEFEVLDALDSLVRKSLLLLDRSGDEVRYGILETIRQFAEEALSEAGEGDATRRLHADFFADQSDIAFEMIFSDLEPSAYQWLDREMANVSSAFRWTVDNGLADPAIRIAATATAIATTSLLRTEPIGWAEEIIELARESGHRQLPRLLAEACRSATTDGRYDDAIRLGFEAIDLHGDARCDPYVWAYGFTGFALGFSNAIDPCLELLRAGAEDPDDRPLRMNLAYLHVFACLAGTSLPEEEIREAVARIAESGAPTIRAMAWWVQAMVAAADGDVPSAIDCYRRAIDGAVASGGRSLEITCRGFLLGLVAQTDDVDTALTGFTTVVESWQRSGDPFSATAMWQLVVLLAKLGDHTGATQLLGALPAQLADDPELLTILDAMDAEAYTKAYEAGTRLDRTSAAELAHELISRARARHAAP